MELDGDEERMRRQLHDFDEVGVGIDAAHPQASLFHRLEVEVVELVAVAVALGDVVLAVDVVGQRPLQEVAGIGAEAHRMALHGERFLLLHQVDDRIGRQWIDFGGGGFGIAQDVAGKFHHRHLHAEADAEERDPMFAGIAHGADLALQASLAEARRHEDAVHPAQQFRGVVVVDVLGVDGVDMDLAVVGGAGMDEALLDALVGVLELDVLADEGNIHLVLGMAQAGKKLFQAGQVGLRQAGDFQLADHHLVEFLRRHVERHLIDAPGVDGLDDMARLDVAETGDLAADLGGEALFGAADDDVGMDADGLQFLDGVLRGLGFQLLGRL